jgi:hypothetical protein
MGWGQLLGGAAGFVLSGFNPAGAMAGAALGGGLDEVTGGGQTGAAREAAQIANASNREALALRQRAYDEDIARQQPFYQASVNALPGYLKGIAAGGEYVRPFTMADFNADPGYAFRLAEGQKQLDRIASRDRNLFGITALNNAQRYGQGMATQDYGRALQDFYGRQEVARNAAAGVVGYGPTSNALAAAAGERLATGAVPLIQNQGYNTANAGLYGRQAANSAYGEIGKAFGSGGFGSLQTGFNNMFGARQPASSTSRYMPSGGYDPYLPYGYDA